MYYSNDSIRKIIIKLIKKGLKSMKKANNTTYYSHIFFMSLNYPNNTKFNFGLVLYSTNNTNFCLSNSVFCTPFSLKNSKLKKHLFVQRIKEVAINITVYRFRRFIKSSQFFLKIITKLIKKVFWHVIQSKLSICFSILQY